MDTKILLSVFALIITLSLISIPNAFAGGADFFVNGPITINQIGKSPVMATFTDNAADGLDFYGEIHSIHVNSLVTGQVTINQGIFSVTAFFTDSGAPGLATGAELSNFVSLLPEPCQAPSSGDWTIIQTCELITNTVTSSNVILQNNSVLLIPNGVTLTIPSENYIRIDEGSGVLIKNGASLQINS